MEIKPYKKDFEYSYTLGAFPTFELLSAKPGEVLGIYASSSFTDMDKLRNTCNEKGVSFNINDKLINRLSDKGNVYVAGVFKKYTQTLDKTRPHLVLVNPSDMGNLGTIIRTAVGFGIRDLAVIEPAADIAVEWVDVDETHKAIVCKVERGNMRPYVYDGRPYKRVQSSTAVMLQEEYERMLAERKGFQSDWEIEINPELKLADLDEWLRTHLK